MISKKRGLTALFFVLLLVAFVVLRGSNLTLNRTRQHPLPSLWFFYVSTRRTRDSQAGILWGRHYSATGKPLGHALPLGPLALTQEAEVAASGSRGRVWVTLGHEVVELQSSGITQRIPVPRGEDVLSVAWLHGMLYGVAESTGSHVQIGRWENNRWKPLLSQVPLGITTLNSGPRQSLWALIADPHNAEVMAVSPRGPLWRADHIAPQGTVGFSSAQAILPYASGQSQFGYMRLSSRGVSRHPFVSVYQAAISVTDTTPLWGLGVKGMVPFIKGHFDFKKIVPWPRPEATTPVVAGNGGPWIVVLDGFSQGTWYNVKTGRFGPQFQIKTPWWAVVRAASLGS